MKKNVQDYDVSLVLFPVKSRCRSVILKTWLLLIGFESFFQENRHNFSQRKPKTFISKFKDLPFSVRFSQPLGIFYNFQITKILTKIKLPHL